MSKRTSTTTTTDQPKKKRGRPPKVVQEQQEANQEEEEHDFTPRICLQLGTNDSSLADLKLSDLDQKYQDATTKVAQLQQQLLVLDNSKMDLNKQLNQLKLSLQQKEFDEIEFKKQMSTLKNKEQDVELNKQQISHLQHQLSLSRAKEQDLELSKQHLEHQLSCSKTKERDLEESMSFAQQQLKELQQQLNVSRCKEQELQQQVSSYKNKQSSLDLLLLQQTQQIKHLESVQQQQPPPTTTQQKEDKIQIYVDERGSRKALLNTITQIEVSGRPVWKIQIEGKSTEEELLWIIHNADGSIHVAHLDRSLPRVQQERLVFHKVFQPRPSMSQDFILDELTKYSNSVKSLTRTSLIVNK